MQIAAEAGLPFACLRVVADTHAMEVPSAALVPLGEDGRVDLPRVLWNLVKSPGQLPQLIAVGRNSGKAMEALKDAARRL